MRGLHGTMGPSQSSMGRGSEGGLLRVFMQNLLQGGARAYAQLVSITLELGLDKYEGGKGLLGGVGVV